MFASLWKWMSRKREPARWTDVHWQSVYMPIANHRWVYPAIDARMKTHGPLRDNYSTERVEAAIFNEWVKAGRPDLIGGRCWLIAEEDRLKAIALRDVAEFFDARARGPT